MSSSDEVMPPSPSGDTTKHQEASNGFESCGVDEHDRDVVIVAVDGSKQSDDAFACELLIVYRASGAYLLSWTYDFCLTKSPLGLQHGRIDVVLWTLYILPPLSKFKWYWRDHYFWLWQSAVRLSSPVTWAAWQFCSRGPPDPWGGPSMDESPPIQKSRGARQNAGGGPAPRAPPHATGLRLSLEAWPGLAWRPKNLALASLVTYIRPWTHQFPLSK